MPVFDLLHDIMSCPYFNYRAVFVLFRRTSVILVRWECNRSKFLAYFQPSFCYFQTCYVWISFNINAKNLLSSKSHWSWVQILPLCLHNWVDCFIVDRFYHVVLHYFQFLRIILSWFWFTCFQWSNSRQLFFCFQVRTFFPIIPRISLFFDKYPGLTPFLLFASKICRTVNSYMYKHKYLCFVVFKHFSSFLSIGYFTLLKSVRLW